MSPRADFLYNGKKNIEELDFNMLEYGFRLYDPAIGRFPSLDPIADNFAWVSGFNYAENMPINHIDLWGLQSYIITPSYNRQTWGDKGYTDKDLAGYDRANKTAETVTIITSSLIVPDPTDAFFGAVVVASRIGKVF